jgi:hypothetical protein
MGDILFQIISKLCKQEWHVDPFFPLKLNRIEDLMKGKEKESFSM